MVTDKDFIEKFLSILSFKEGRPTDSQLLASYLKLHVKILKQRNDQLLKKINEMSNKELNETE